MDLPVQWMQNWLYQTSLNHRFFYEKRLNSSSHWLSCSYLTGWWTFSADSTWSIDSASLWQYWTSMLENQGENRQFPQNSTKEHLITHATTGNGYRYPTLGTTKFAFTVPVSIGLFNDPLGQYSIQKSEIYLYLNLLEHKIFVKLI